MSRKSPVVQFLLASFDEDLLALLDISKKNGARCALFSERKCDFDRYSRLGERMRGEAAKQLMLAAAQLAKEDRQNEEDACGVLPPCRLLPYLSHYTSESRSRSRESVGGYIDYIMYVESEWTGEEYEMMERDRGKYLLYMAAIEAAIEDLAAQEPRYVGEAN